MVEEEKDLTSEQEADAAMTAEDADESSSQAEDIARQEIEASVSESEEAPLVEIPAVSDQIPAEDQEDLSEPVDQLAEISTRLDDEAEEALLAPEQVEDLPAEEIEEEAVEVEAVGRKPKTSKMEAEPIRLEEGEGPDLAGIPHAEGETDGRNWYVVHCYSGYENKVRHNLEQRIESMGMKDMIFDVVVPTEEEIEVKEGKRRTVERRVFPGYILVNMMMTEESWYVVRNTPGVTSFVGQGNTPLPLRPEEVAQIVKRMEAEAPRIKVTFRQGERVRIVDGPFNDFRGTVAEIDMERAKVRVMVNFFGRETPVELDFLQVEKA